MCTEGRKVHRSAKTSTQKCKYGYKEVQVQLLSTCRGSEGAHRSTGAQTYREQCQHAHKEVHVSVYSASIHKYECWYTDVSRQTYRSIRHTSTAIRTGKSERKTNHSGVMPPSHPSSPFQALCGCCFRVDILSSIQVCNSFIIIFGELQVLTLIFMLSETKKKEEVWRLNCGYRKGTAS